MSDIRTAKTVKRSGLPKGLKIENDRISAMKIVRTRGFMLALSMEFESGRQPLFRGHYNTGNIGHMLITLAELLGVNEDGESDDILEEFVGTPLRVAVSEELGGMYVSRVWLGHFMKDKWMGAGDIVKCGPSDGGGE